MKVLVKCTDVSMGYAAKPVLEKVDASLEKGRIYCIFGRNGSGKTTMLKSMAGMLPVLRGDILLDGRISTRMSPAELARMRSVVLTGRPDIASLKVEDFVSYGRYPYTRWLGRMGESDREKVDLSLEEAGVTNLRHRNIEELSDGEMQKVSIARALAQDTDIMFLDEIASHLDLVNKAEIFSLLKSIARSRESCIVFTSHDIQFSLQLADDFIVLKDGMARSYSSAEFVKDKRYSEVLSSPHVDIEEDGSRIRFR